MKSPAKLREAKAGVAYLAKRTNAPIIPVYIDGLYSGSEKKTMFRRHASVTFGKSIYPEDIFEDREYLPEEYKGVAKKVLTEIEKLSPTTYE